MYTGVLIISAIMVIIGVFFVLLSLKASRQELETRSVGIIVIAGIPIVLGGDRKWVLYAIALISFLFIILVFSPELLTNSGR